SRHGELAQHPPVADGVVQGYRIAVVTRFAHAPEAVPDGTDVGGAVEASATLAEHLEADVDDLHVVIGANIAVGIRWIISPVVVHAVEVASWVRYRQLAKRPGRLMDNWVLNIRNSGGAALHVVL